MDPQTIIIPITFFSAILGIAAIAILLFFNRRNIFANRLLALSLFGLTYVWLTDILYLLEWIRYVPHLHRSQHPIHFLVAPASYLYVRTLLNNENHFRAYDWIHLLPFAAHTLELSPFFFSATAAKLQAIEQVLLHPDLIAQNPEGVLPPYAHLYIKGLLGLIYMVFQWRLVRRFAHHTRKKRLPFERTLLSWLNGFTLLMTLMFISVIIAVYFEFGRLDAYLSLRLLLGSINLFILFYLMFKPSILYGLHPYAVVTAVRKSDRDVPAETPVEEEERPSILTPEQQQFYAAQIEKYIRNERPFLRPGFNLNDLVEQLEIPRHHLSACINQYFEVNFNDFINEYRVGYILEEMPPEKWEQLTIEGVGQEAGFNSRSSFYNAFKKFAGMNPSEFRQSILQGKVAG